MEAGSLPGTRRLDAYRPELVVLDLWVPPAPR